jgi:hypothetical protein
MFKELELTQGNVVAIEINGRITNEDYVKLDTLIKKAEREHNRTRLFIHVNDIGGIELQDMAQDLKKYFKSVKNIEKAAIVGNDPIDKIIAKIADPYVEDSDGEVKYFPVSGYDAAKIWVVS